MSEQGDVVPDEGIPSVMVSRKKVLWDTGIQCEDRFESAVILLVSEDSGYD